VSAPVPETAPEPGFGAVQAADAGEGAAHTRSRRLVHRKALDDKRRFEGRDVVATRFVRGCPRGHVDDLDWRRFVHRRGSECPPTRPLWLDEQGTTFFFEGFNRTCDAFQIRRLALVLGRVSGGQGNFVSVGANFLKRSQVARRLL
jgi:hypothetical protein